MASFLIKKEDKTNSIVYMDYNMVGYKFSPRKTNDSYIDVKEVKVVDSSLIDNILTIKFDRRFKELLALAIKIENDTDATEDDAVKVLGEVELVRQILLNKYHKFLRKSKEEMFLKRLRIIENEMRIKILFIRDYENMLIQNIEEPKIGRRK